MLKLDIPESRSEVTGKFCSVVLGNDGKHHLDRSCEKWRSITKSQGGEKILQTINRRKADWIGHILCMTCLLNHNTEGKIEGRIEVTRRRIRRKQLLDFLKCTRGYWKLKVEALDRNVWRTRFIRSYVSCPIMWSADALDPRPISKVSAGTFL